MDSWLKYRRIFWIHLYLSRCVFLNKDPLGSHKLFDIIARRESSTLLFLDIYADETRHTSVKSLLGSIRCASASSLLLAVPYLRRTICVKIQRFKTYKARAWQLKILQAMLSNKTLPARRGQWLEKSGTIPQYALSERQMHLAP